MTFLLLIIAASFYAIGSYLDLRSSVRGKYFGTKEGKKLLKNADGDIDVTKKVLFTVLVGIALLMVYVFIHQIVGILSFVIVGCVVLYIALDNARAQKVNREKQIAWLTKTAQYTPDQATELFNSGHFEGAGTVVTPKSGRKYYSNFKWITAPTPEMLRVKLIELALRPSGTWFPEEGR